MIWRNPNDFEARDHYALSLNQIHNGALDVVKFAQVILKSINFYVLNVVACEIWTHIDLCIDGESLSGIPYNDNFLLPTYANVIS